jgi:hypothetical protein
MNNIFNGRKGKYNQQILKALLSTWKMKTSNLALNIQDQTENLNYKSVYCIISRKGSRLEELQKKDYIKRNNDKSWSLTFKGILVASAITKNLNLEIAYDRYVEEIHNEWDVEEIKYKFHLRKYLKEEALSNLYEYCLTKENLLYVVSEVSKLLFHHGKEYDNLEALSSNDLFTLTISTAEQNFITSLIPSTFSFLST